MTLAVKRDVKQQINLNSVTGVSVTRELGLYMSSQDGSNGTLSPILQGDIAPSINIQYNSTKVLLVSELYRKTKILMMNQRKSAYFNIADYFLMGR